MFKDLEAQKGYIKEQFQDCDIVEPTVNDNLIIYIKKSNIIDFLKFIKNDNNLSFKILIDVFGIDLATYPVNIHNKRFEIVYNLLSLKLNSRITIKTSIDIDESVFSVSSVFPTANWFEREVFDMFGINFNNHPDLRRILTDYNFEGHPLRKDFPLTGYKEVRYDEQNKQIIYEDVKLMQEFRNFDFETPWFGPDYPKKD